MPVTSVSGVDMHSLGGGGPGVAPDDRVVPDDPAGRVVERAQDRVPGLRRGVQVRHQALDLGRVDDLGVDALHLVDFGPPAHGAQGRVVVGQREVPAPGEHHVVVQVGGERPVELHGPVVEADALGGQVVRPEDGRVPPRAAAADVPLVQHGDVGDPVVDGEVVGGREAVHAAADDDHVVGVPQRLVRPGPRPRAAGQAVAEQGERAVLGGSAAPGVARGADCCHGVPPGDQPDKLVHGQHRLSMKRSPLAVDAMVSALAAVPSPSGWLAPSARPPWASRHARGRVPAAGT